MERKKRIELNYLKEACRASTLFPRVEPIPHDPLDFLFPSPSGALLGVEVTELCQQGDRQESARLAYVAPKAKRLYAKIPSSKAVNVSPVFSQDADEMHVDDLAQGLAEFVFEHQDANANLSWREHRDMPKGYSHIGVFPPFDFEPDGNWRYFRGFSSERADRDLLQARIAEKNARIGAYRKLAPKVWLLIVNDRFLGPGEVWLYADDLARWTFDFDFDKVLLFERDAGGNGEVTELGRRQ